MKGKNTIFFLVLFVFCFYLSSGHAAEYQLHGTTRTEIAYRLPSTEKFTKLRNQLLLNETGTLSDQLRFKASGRFFYDAVYDIFDYYPRNVRSDQRWDAELRDTYVDYSGGPWDVRLGKQQVVWGEAVGLFCADVVNAKDLREYVLPDFDLIRIPEWMVNVEYSKKNFYSQFIWIPVLQFNKSGVANAPFAFPYPVPGGSTFTADDPSEPKNGFKNSEVGYRASYLINGFDLGAFYFHSWTKSPVLYRTIDAGVYHFFPQYKRLDIIGATFSKEINDYVIKGECVFYPKGYFSVSDTNSPDGVVTRSFADYIIGFDHTFFDKLNFNFQLIQRVIPHFSEYLVNEKRVNTAVSVRVSRDFLNHKVEAEFLIIESLMRPDLLCRPKIKYNFTRSWQASLGADLFQGEPSGMFGEFRKNSRLTVEFIHKF